MDRVRPRDRVRYEVYGMPIDGIIEGAMAPEREAAAAKAKTEAAAAEMAAAAGNPDDPAWPTLEQLQGKSPRPAPRTRRPRG